MNVDKKHWKLAGKNGPVTANITLEKDPISVLHREAEQIRAKHEASAKVSRVGLHYETKLKFGSALGLKLNWQNLATLNCFGICFWKMFRRKFAKF